MYSTNLIAPISSHDMHTSPHLHSIAAISPQLLLLALGTQWHVPGILAYNLCLLQGAVKVIDSSQLYLYAYYSSEVHTPASLRYAPHLFPVGRYKVISNLIKKEYICDYYLTCCCILIIAIE